MFEKTLGEKLKSLFDLDKYTYSLPSDNQEQETIFIEVDSAKSHVKDKLFISRVTGKVRVFANSDKLPYGYFHKKLSEATATESGDIFFYDFEENAGTINNITERHMSFVYFYSSQYDPNVGEITSLDTELEFGT